MYSYEKLKEKIQQRLTPYRYEHTLGVVKVAEELAERYGGDVQKARVAALLHDCAKTMDREELFLKARTNGIFIDEVCQKQKELLHGPVGAMMVQDDLGIKDHEILKAIEFHTTGRAGMTQLEKIIYLADYIESGRNYPGVDRLRKLAYKNLDQGLLQSLNNTIQFLLKKNALIHINTINARNDLLLNTYTNIEMKE